MIEEVWKDFLKIATQELGTRIVETWIKATSIFRYDKELQLIYIKAPNSFVKKWISSNYQQLFEVSLKRLFNNQALKVIFLEAAELEKNILKVELLDKKTIENQSINLEFKEKKPEINQKFNLSYKIKKNNFTGKKLNENYKFENFIVGQNNSFAYAAASAVVEKLGMLYNPLFFYGGVGLGKTHLLQAIGNKVLESTENYKVIYQTTDRFISDFINSIRYNNINKFKNLYKDIDLLLIDDIQFISNKEQTQEVLFNIFNNLYDSKKQIVFSSDALPKDLSGLAARLKSRMECGLITDIKMPMLETKIAILKKKAEDQNYVITTEIAEYIASNVTSSIRELEGVLLRVLAFSSLTNQKITLELTKKVLNFSPPPKNNSTSFDIILKELESVMSFNIFDLKSKSRNKELNLARQITMYLMKKYTNKSLKDIGLFFDRKNHTTISHAINKISESRKTDYELDRKLKDIEIKFNQ